jgi:hypothetical protein
VRTALKMVQLLVVLSNSQACPSKRLGAKLFVSFWLGKDTEGKDEA